MVGKWSDILIFIHWRTLIFIGLLFDLRPPPLPSLNTPKSYLNKVKIQKNWKKRTHLLNPAHWCRHFSNFCQFGDRFGARESWINKLIWLSTPQRYRISRKRYAARSFIFSQYFYTSKRWRGRRFESHLQDRFKK